MTNASTDLGDELLDSLSKSGKPITPNPSTDGPSFGLIPTKDSPIVRELPYKRVIYGSVKDGLAADPDIANSKLFKAEEYPNISSVIRPLETGVYRVDFFCTLQIDIDTSDTVSKPHNSILLEPRVHIKTAITAGKGDIKGVVYNTFKPTSLCDRSLYISRLVRLQKDTPIYVQFILRQSRTAVRLWQNTRKDDQDLPSTTETETGAQSGLYLTKM